MRNAVGVLLAGALLVGGCESEPPAAPVAASSAPAAAAVAPDFAVVLDEALIVPAARELPATAALAGPGLALRVTRTGTVAQLDQSEVRQVAGAGAVPEDSPVPLPAGDGHEFLIARLAPITARTDLSHIVPTPIELRLGDTRQTVKLDSEREPHRHGDRTLVARVATGAPAEASITVGGRRQVVDLRTGKSKGQIPAYARHVPAGTTEVEAWGAGNTMSVDADVEASLEPYAGKWAKPGHTWLYIGLDLTMRNWNRTAVLGDLDLDRSLKITVDGRTRTGDFGTKSLTPVEMIGDASQLSAGFAIEVLDRGRPVVTVRLTPKGKLEVRGQPVTFVTAQSKPGTIKLR